MIEWLTDPSQLISHTPGYEVIVTGISPGMTCSIVFLLFIAFLFGLPLVNQSTKEADVKSKEQIEALIKKVEDSAVNGPSKFFGMSYEQGVYETARWLLGETDDDPFPEA